MTILQLPIPDTDRTILRPIVMDIVRDLRKLTFITPDTVIRYKGGIGEQVQPGSTIGEENTEKQSYGNQPAIDIEVQERLLETEASANNQIRVSSPPIFYEPNLGITIRPDYAFHEVQLTLTLRHRDRPAALRWRDELRNKLQQGRLTNLHSVKYHYYFHPAILFILGEIHRLRENVDGYGDTYREWLQNHFSEKVTEVTNQSGTHSELAVTESMGTIQGWFEFPLTPEESNRSDNKANEEITVTYTFQYDRVMSMAFTYPISVHNQLLSDRFRQSENLHDANNVGKVFSYSNGLMEDYRFGRIADKLRKMNGVAIPGFDDFIPDMVLRNTYRVFTALIQLDQEEAPSPLLNLNEVPPYEFKPIVLDFMKGEIPFMLDTYQSIFQLHLYRGKEMLVPNKTLKIDEDLLVSSTIELDFRNIHHLRFSIVNDLSLLPPEAIDRITKYPWPDDGSESIIDIILDLLFPDLKICWDHDKQPTAKDLLNLIHVMQNAPRGKYMQFVRCSNTPGPHDPGGIESDKLHLRLVGGFFIDSSKEKGDICGIIQRR